MNIEPLRLRTGRGAFVALDPAQLAGSSASQRDTIARTILAQGPALIRRGHAERLVGRAVIAGALAAAATLIFMAQSREAAMRASLAVPAVASSCEADAPPTPITEEQLDRSRIQISSRIRAVTTGATQVAIVEATPCNTRLELREGTLALQARNLGGGTLSIDTPHGEVRATASLMRIVSLASSTSVSVVHGEVVMRTLHGAESVGAGRAVTIGRTGVERYALSGQDRKNVIDAFDAPAAAPQPVQYAVPASELPPHPPVRAAKALQQSGASASKLLARAETLWRNGDRGAARWTFRAAAEDRGPTGEAAWVRLARLELSAGSSKQALIALQARKARAERGVLGAEALWLEAEALGRAGRSQEAVKAAAVLLRDYPRSPQAPAARRLLGQGKMP